MELYLYPDPVELNDEEILEEALSLADQEDLTDEDLQGIEGLDFVRFPHLRPRLAVLKRRFLQTSVTRGKMREALKRAAEKGAKLAVSRVVQGDTVVFWQGLLPADSGDLRFFAETKPRTNIQKPGISHDKPIVIMGMTAFITPTVVASDTDWTNIVRPMLESEITLRVQKDDGEKIVKLPTEALAGQVQSVATALDGSTAATSSFYAALQSGKFQGFFPLRIYVPARKTIVADVNFRSSFSGNTTYWFHVLIQAKEVL